MTCRCSTFFILFGVFISVNAETDNRLFHSIQGETKSSSSDGTRKKNEIYRRLSVTERSYTYFGNKSGNNRKIEFVLSQSQFVNEDINNETGLEKHRNLRDSDGHIHLGNYLSFASGVGERNRRQITDGKCVVQLKTSSIVEFSQEVLNTQSSYVYLRLNPAAGSGISITGSKIVLRKNIWIWTFYGKEGGLEFLKWPEEFGLWSLGLLYSFVIREPMNLTLERVSGDCSNLEVGQIDNDIIISNALKNLTEEMMQYNKAKYATGFYCYKKRVFIKDTSLYKLCMHIYCPLEAISHTCCWYFYNKTISRWAVSKRQQTFQYDILWWVFPSIISMILLIYSPVLITYIVYKCTTKENGKVVFTCIGTRGFSPNINDGTIHVNQENQRSITILLAGYHHVTLAKTIQIPFKRIHSKSACSNSSMLTSVTSRLIRLLLPVFSLSIIALQVILDYYFLYDYVCESMRKGVPMGFRSMLGGYSDSKKNFLPYLGGPYLAIAMYVFVSGFLLIIPDSPIQIVSKRIRQHSEENSPLTPSNRTICSLASVRTVDRNGYFRIHNLLKAQFYMLLNYRFWERCIHIQVQRWKACVSGRQVLILLPLYVVFCLAELTLATIFYTCPVVSLAHIVVSYVSQLCTRTGRTVFLKLFTLILSVCLFCGVAYSLIIFGTIFMDATLFFTRVVIFTFTGLVIYPKMSYGYLIFGFTVFYYLWNSVTEYCILYDQLFKDTLHVATSLQRGNDNCIIVHNINGKRGIPEPLFEFVIEVHHPRRKQMFLSFLKTACLLSVLSMLIHILLSTDHFQDLRVIMHVGTALFICAIPQIVKVVWKGKDNKKEKKLFREALLETVREYIGYFVDDDSNSLESD